MTQTYFFICFIFWAGTRAGAQNGGGPGPGPCMATRSPRQAQKDTKQMNSGVPETHVVKVLGVQFWGTSTGNNFSNLTDFNELLHEISGI